jgi:hypothetical protein
MLRSSQTIRHLVTLNACSDPLNLLHLEANRNFTLQYAASGHRIESPETNYAFDLWRQSQLLPVFEPFIIGKMAAAGINVSNTLIAEQEPILKRWGIELGNPDSVTAIPKPEFRRRLLAALKTGHPQRFKSIAGQTGYAACSEIGKWNVEMQLDFGGHSMLRIDFIIQDGDSRVLLGPDLLFGVRCDWDCVTLANADMAVAEIVELLNCSIDWIREAIEFSTS